MRVDLIQEIIQLREAAWAAAGSDSELGLVGTCLREHASFRLFGSDAQDDYIGFRVWRRMHLRWKKRATLAPLLKPNSGVLLLDSGSRNAAHAVPYVEAMLGQQVGHFISRDDLPGPLSFAGRLPVAFHRYAWKVARKCIKAEDRVHRALGLFSVAELAVLLEYIERHKVTHVVDFAPYLIDHNLLYLLLRERGVSVTKVPSSGPLRTHNHILLADRVALSTPYHVHEMGMLGDTFKTGEVLRWIPERALEYTGKYATADAPTPPRRTVGFYSHGGWVRAAQQHTSDGLDIHAQEEALLHVLGRFVQARPDWKLVVFPHPREKAADVVDRTRAHYRQFLPLEQVDLRLAPIPTSQQFEAADIGVAVFSTVVYERLFCGYKTRIFNLSNPDFPAQGTSLNGLCARSEDALLETIEMAAERSREDDFQLLGLTDYRWDAYAQLTAQS